MNIETEQRDRVAKIAATRPEEALALAREVRDPWFRCQAEQCLPAIAQIDPGLAEGAVSRLSPSRAQRVARDVARSTGTSPDTLIPWPHIP